MRRDPMSKRVVAVIDDDSSLRKSLARLLTLRGFACETCGSAEEFLDHVAISKANCVLIDINLGDGLSGIESEGVRSVSKYCCDDRC